MRVVFHVDMDAFFVSVEELFNPSLRGKAVVVGGKPNQRGVVAAASYEARKYGVHSALPLRTAYKLCPQAVFLDGHPERYRQYSHKVREVLCSFTPRMEMASIDEAYLDMSGTRRRLGPPLAAAHAVHEAVRTETGLRCSIGAATSRLVAKVCSDQAKPNGVLWISPGREARFLAPLDIRKIPGVGKVAEERLHACGVRKVRDLAKLEEGLLSQRFGRWGLTLAGKARGEDAGGWFDSEIGEHANPKSISHEHTFRDDTAEIETLDGVLARLTEIVARRLREQRLFARTVQIKLRYSDFSTFTRARTLEYATEIDRDLLREVRSLFQANWTGKPIRLLGVYVSSLEEKEGQLSLLDQEGTQRWREALAAADRLRNRFGDDSVSLASGIKSRFRERTHEAMPNDGDTDDG